MSTDFDEFKGTLPYSSDLFAVYQPILGWKSRSSLSRFIRDNIRLIESSVIDVIKKGPSLGSIKEKPRPEVPDDLLPPRVPSLLRTTSTQELRNAAIKFERKNGHKPTGKDWKKIVDDIDFNKIINDLANNLK